MQLEARLYSLCNPWELLGLQLFQVCCKILEGLMVTVFVMAVFPKIVINVNRSEKLFKWLYLYIRP